MRPKQRMKSTLFSSFLQNSCFRLTFFGNFILPHFSCRKQGGFCEKIRRYYLFSGLNLFLVPICKTGVCPAKVSCCISNYFCRDTLPSFFFCFFFMPQSDRQQLPAGSAGSQSGSQPDCRTICISGGHGHAAVFLYFEDRDFRKRSKNTLTRPIPPSTIITPAISRYKNGWRDCMARMAM